MDVHLHGPLTFRSLVTPKGESFWSYSPGKWNCQNFLLRTLENNNLLTPELEKFIYQDPLHLLEGVGDTKLRVLTDLASLGTHYVVPGLKKLFGWGIEDNHLIKITHKGSLKKFGYSSKSSEKDRHKSLLEAIKEYGKDEVIKKVNALAVLNKNKPIGNIFQNDLKFIQLQ